MTTQILPAEERVFILSERLGNLERGCGDYDASNRPLAIKETKLALDAALSGLLAEVRA